MWAPSNTRALCSASALNEKASNTPVARPAILWIIFDDMNIKVQQEPEASTPRMFC